MAKVKGFLIKGNEAKVVEIEDELDIYYDLLECTTIDIVCRHFEYEPFDIVCDDEGLLKDHPIPTVFDEQMNPVIHGPVLVVGMADDEGVLTSLSDSLISKIEKNIGTIMYPTNEDDPDSKILEYKALLWTEGFEAPF